MSEPKDEELPEQLHDEKGILKLGMAGAIGAVILVAEVALLLGNIAPEPTVAGGIHTMFIAYATAVGQFLYKKFNGGK